MTTEHLWCEQCGERPQAHHLTHAGLCTECVEAAFDQADKATDLAAKLAEVTAERDRLREALAWIVEFIDDHPEWDQSYFREGGEAHAESDWFDEARAALANTTPPAHKRDPFVAVLASLVAAVSLLEKGGKKAAPSDKMFEQMLDDYRKAIAEGRAAIAKAEPAP